MCQEVNRSNCQRLLIIYHSKIRTNNATFHQVFSILHFLLFVLWTHLLFWLLTFFIFNVYNVNICCTRIRKILSVQNNIISIRSEPLHAFHYLNYFKLHCWRTMWRVISRRYSIFEKLKIILLRIKYCFLKY